MLTLDEAIKDVSLIRPYINQELSVGIVKAHGYNWHPERIERISNEAAQMIAEGFPAKWAFMNAFWDELAMYGDGSIDAPIGFILSPSKWNAPVNASADSFCALRFRVRLHE